MVRNAVEKSGVFKESGVGEKGCSIVETAENGRQKRRKKGEKKIGASSEWVQFKDLTLCSGDYGEAEMLFEAVEELKDKIDRLEKAKNSVGIWNVMV